MPVTAFYASVVVDLAAEAVKDRLFTYRIPESLSNEIAPGVSVLVPFGKKQAIAGYVVSCSENLPKSLVNRNIQLKDVMAILDSELFFNKEYIDFLQWVADYYCCGLIDIVSAAIPTSLAPSLKQKLYLQGKNFCVDSALKPQEKVIVDLLLAAKKNELSLSKLKQLWCKTTNNKESQFYKALNVLLSLNIIGRNISATSKKSKQSGWRDPLKYLHDKSDVKPDVVALTEDQRRVFCVLSNNLYEKVENAYLTENQINEQGVPWLLHGVTGSGKTEIYLRLVEETLKLDRTALLMVPEIALTPQLAQRLVERFGKQVAIWHSNLSDGEHYDTWKRIQNGELKILLGARSAILVNLPNLGLIIVDEEHDSSYKQSNAPRYNAKTLALEKAKRHNALVVYGSATPDVVTYYNASEAKRVLSLPKRIFNQEMPRSVLVDMREEFTAGSRSIYSRALLSSLNDCLELGQQAILLVNRRGYASHVFCRSCGYVSVCKNCSVTLVYHRHLSADSTKDSGRLVCHHCGYQAQSISICPQCQGPFLKHYGLGTQKAEMDLKKLLPQTKILRLDSDTTQRKGSHQEIFEKFASGKADVLIGTQMVAKGLDNRNVTLVGILAADAAFSLPDYRSAERGFQLLTQVAGRAGRGELPGIVVVQTFNPDMLALKVSLANDYLNFYDAELETRRTFCHPPFGQIIRILVVCEQAEGVEMAGERLVERLSNFLADQLPSSLMTILGPAPCVIEKLHGKYRQHLIVKNQAGKKGHDLVTSFLKQRNFGEDVHIAVDVDAIDLL